MINTHILNPGGRRYAGRGSARMSPLAGSVKPNTVADRHGRPGCVHDSVFTEAMLDRDSVSEDSVGDSGPTQPEFYTNRPPT